MSAQLDYAPQPAMMGNSPTLQNSIAARDGAYMSAPYAHNAPFSTPAQPAAPGYDSRLHTFDPRTTNFDQRNVQFPHAPQESFHRQLPSHRREPSLERPRSSGGRDRSLERAFAYSLTGNSTDFGMDRERRLLTPNPPRLDRSYDTYSTLQPAHRDRDRDLAPRIGREHRSRSFDEQNLLDGTANPYFGTLLTTAQPLANALPGSLGAQLNQAGQMLHPDASYAPLPQTSFQHQQRLQEQHQFTHMSDSGLQKECMRLQQELDLTREKLNSCMNSIKNFWSPELKKERALRKEEAAKYSVLSEHLQLLQAEKQKLVMTIDNLEAELQASRQSRGLSDLSLRPTGHEAEYVKLHNDKLMKDLKLLKKTVEDLEYKLSSQRQTLNAREENIRRLTDILQAKGIDVSHLEENRLETERLRAQLYEVTKQKREMESILIERDADTSQSREDIENVVLEMQTAKRENEALRKQMNNCSALQSALDTKESKILTLESEIRLLEDEIARLRDVAIGGTPATSPSSGIGMEDYEKIIQHLRTNERILKNRFEHIAAELSKREADVYAWQTKLETAEKQAQDQQHHIHVLKEQIKAKDQKLATVNSDLDDLRKKVKEKESNYEKKSKLLQQAQQEKRSLETDLSDLREQLEIREKRMTLLQRKVENLEDLVNDKDAQIQASKSRLLAMTADHSNTDSVKLGLEEALKDKERQLERMKELKDQLEKDHVDEINMYKKMNNDLRAKMESAQKEVDEKHTQIAAINEEMQEMKAEKLRRDTEKTHMDILLTQRNAEMNELQQEIERQKRSLRFEAQQSATAYEQRIRELEQQLLHLTELNTKLQCEADRYAMQIKANDLLLQERDRQLKEAHDQIVEVREKMSQVKRTQQATPTGSRKFLGGGQTDLGSEIEELQMLIREKDERIFELEQAVKEGMRSAADRETQIAERDLRSREVERQAQRLETTNQELKHRVEALRKDLDDREMRLRQLETHSVSNSSESESLKRENRALQSELGMIRKSLKEKESKLEVLESQCSEIHMDEIRKLRKQNQEMTLRISSLNKTLEEKLERVRILEQERYFVNRTPEELERLQRSNQETTFRVQHLQRTLEEKEERIKTLETECTTKHLVEIEQMRSRNRDLLSKMLDLEKQLTEKSNQVSELLRSNAPATSTSEIAVLRQSLKEKEERLAFLESECFRNQAMEIERLRSLNEDYQSKFVSQRRVQDDRSDKFCNLEIENKNLMEDLKKVRREKEEEESINLSLRKQLNDKETRVKALESQCFDSQAGEIERLKREVQDALQRVSMQKRITDEKEEQLRRMQTEKERLLDDMSALRKRNEEIEVGYAGASQRLQEREERMQLIETEFGGEIDRLRTSNQDMTNKVAVLRTIVDEKDAKLGSLECEMQRRGEELRVCLKQREDAEAGLNALRAQLREAEERNRNLEQQYLKAQHAEVENLKLENQDLVRKLSELKERFFVESEKLQSISQELQRSKEEIKQQRKQYDELLREAERVKQDFLDVQSQLKTMENECQTRHVQELERQQRGLAEANSAIVTMKRQLADDAEQSQFLHTQISELQNQLQAASRSLKEKEELFKQQAKELERTMSDMNFLQRTIYEKDEKYREQVGEIERLKKNEYDSSANTKVFRKQLDDALEKQQKLAAECDQARRDLELVRRANQEKDDRIHILETECFQQQSREIEQLKNANQECQNKLAVLRNLLQERDEHIKQLEVEHTVKHGNIMAEFEKQLKDSNQRTEALKAKLEEREQRIRQLEAAHAELSRQPSRDRISNTPQLRSVSREDLEQLRTQLEMATRDAHAMHNRLQEKDERIHFLETECFQTQTFEMGRLRKENEELSEQVQILVQRIDELESEGRAALANSAVQKNEETEKLRKQMHDANSIMERLNAELQEKAEKLSLLENEMQNSKTHISEIERLRKFAAECEKRASDGEQCLKEYERHFQEFNKRNQDYEELFRETEKRMQDYEQRIRDGEQLLRDSESRYVALQAAHDQLQKMSQQNAQQASQTTKSEEKALMQANAQIETLRNQLQQAHFEVEKQQTMLQQAFVEIESQSGKLQQAGKEIEMLRSKLQQMAEAEASRSRAPQPAAESEALRGKLVEAEKLLTEANQRVAELFKQLEECRHSIMQLEQDNRRLLCDYYDMKHEALVASLCEKDANVALMQLAGPPNPAVQKQIQQIQTDKAKLQEQLKEVAQVKAQIQAQLRDSGKQQR